VVGVVSPGIGPTRTGGGDGGAVLPERSRVDALEDPEGPERITRVQATRDEPGCEAKESLPQRCTLGPARRLDCTSTLQMPGNEPTQQRPRQSSHPPAKNIRRIVNAEVHTATANK
jgi:hypothetical protein